MIDLSNLIALPQFICETPEVWAVDLLKDKFDGFWVSSLTRSFQKGYSDNMTLPHPDYIEYCSRLRLHTDKPIVIDVDTLAADPDVAAMWARQYAAAGASMIVIEDKGNVKANSLFATGKVEIPLKSPEEMCKLLTKVRSAIQGTSLKICARTEYLPRNMENPDFVVDLAEKYYEAGADVVAVHNGKEAKNLEPLKYVLQKLKANGRKTCIIPQEFTPRAASGEFDELADVVILGNVFTSKMRTLMETVTREDLLEVPNFKPLLKKSESLRPKSRSMVVLGAAPNRATGQWFVENYHRQEQFASMAALHGCESLILISGSDFKSGPQYSDLSDLRIRRYSLKDSMGECHTLEYALQHVHSDEVLIVYADYQRTGDEALNMNEVVYDNDRFDGAFLADTGAVALATSETMINDFMVSVVSKLGLTIRQVG